MYLFFYCFGLLQNGKFTEKNKIILATVRMTLQLVGAGYVLSWVIFSMFVGTVGVLGSYVLIIIQPDPWFEPKYMIPLSGMIIGN